MLIIATDGAARGNPGPAGIGYLITDEEGQVLAREAAYIGETTNNVAEYTALIRALQRALTIGQGGVKVQTDSELMARQLNGEYRIRQPHLVPLYQEAVSLLRRFGQYQIQHVPREANREADRLANEGIDRYLAGETGQETRGGAAR